MKTISLIVLCLFTGCVSSPPKYYAIDVVLPLYSTKVTLEEIGVYRSNDITDQILQTVDSCNTKPILNDKFIPAYPDIAQRAFVEGTVTIKAWFDTYGSCIKSQVQNVEVWDCINCKTGRRVIQVPTERNPFIVPTLNAIQKYSYSPYRDNCKPNTFISIVKFCFTLQKPV